MSDPIRCHCPECGKECCFKVVCIGDIGVCGRCGMEFRIKQRKEATAQAAEQYSQSKKPSREDKVLDAMAAWFERHEYQVEGQWRNPNSWKEVVVGKAVAFGAKRLAVAMLGHAIRGARLSVQGGAKEKQVAEAMEPYLRLTDFVAVQFGSLFSMSKSNRIIAIILADELYPEDVISRFKKLMESAAPVAKLGLRTNYQHHGMMIHPLVVYTRSKWFAEDAGYVLRRGWERWLWGRIYLQPAVIDVQAKRIEWADKKGLARVGTLLGVKPPISKSDVGDMFSALGSP